MNIWLFIFINALIIATIVEGIKKIPVFKKTWKLEVLRCICIMLIAFAVSIVVTYLIGVSFGILSSFLQALGYAVVAWFIQKAIGEEVLHKIVNQIASKLVDAA